MTRDVTRITHRISQLEHQRIITSSKFKFYQAFSFAGAAMLIAAILFYLQTDSNVLLFFSYAVLLVDLLGFCLYALYAHLHDTKINEKIKKNYELLLEEQE